MTDDFASAGSSGHVHSGRSHSNVLPLLDPVSAGCVGDTVCHLPGHSFLHDHHHSSGCPLLLCAGKRPRTPEKKNTTIKERLKKKKSL